MHMFLFKPKKSLQHDPRQQPAGIETLAAGREVAVWLGIGTTGVNLIIFGRNACVLELEFDCLTQIQID